MVFARTGDVTVVIEEDVSGGDVSTLRWQLHDIVLAGTTHVVADVSSVHRLSSATLATLLGVHRRCRARGGGVVLRGCNAATLDLLYRNGLHRVFHVENAPELSVPRRRRGSG
jgi:anti-sigma B factor antagonist